MQRERRYRSKLLYLVRTSLEACVAPQAECMQVVWGPWKLRTLLGMGITGMGGLPEPSAVSRGSWWSPLRELRLKSQLASLVQTIWPNKSHKMRFQLLFLMCIPVTASPLKATRPCNDITVIKHFPTFTHENTQEVQAVVYKIRIHKCFAGIFIKQKSY